MSPADAPIAPSLSSSPSPTPGAVPRRATRPPGEDQETVIVGAGPAGMLLAWLMVKAGEPVHVVEKHPDFSREFRGEGIQASVVLLLRELGLLDELLGLGIATRAVAARIFLDADPVAVLRGVGEEEDFGIILHQEKFLAFLHERLSQSPLYRATFSASVSGFVVEDGRARAVEVRRGDVSETIRGRAFVVAAGRGTGLRKKLGVEVDNVDTHFNILWLRLPRPKDPGLIPDGFRAYLSGDALFILYTAADGGIQMAWSRRDEQGLIDRDFARRRERLLAESPAPLRAFLEESFQPTTVTHFLKVQSDCARQWSRHGVLFIGDAAHTMSPVAGQGINLAMRDAVVAANHILAAHAAGQEVDDALGERFRLERLPEIRKMQRFQRGLGYFMLGAPRWQVRGFFKVALKILDALGIRRRLLKQVQGGVTTVAYRPPPRREDPRAPAPG